MAVPSPQDRVAPLLDVVAAVTRQFPELGHLAPGGVLRVPVDVGRLTALRLELPNEFLHLQSIGLVTADGTDASARARVTASSWYPGYGDSFDPQHAFDWDHPRGTVVHTGKDELSRLEVRFARPVRLTEIRLRNVGNATAVRARRLRVVGRTWWGRQHVLFDGAQRQRELRATVKAYDLGTADPQVRALVPILADTLAGAYPAARKKLRQLDPDPELATAFRTVVNAELLPSREQLWTTHGPCRAFRFWTAAQQRAYVAFTAEVVEALRGLTPHACFGFGAVLSVVRDKALIPHDDDLDVLVAFEPGEAATIAEGLALVTTTLEADGFSVRGAFPTHRQVGRGGRGKHVDVFVGLFEGDVVSWYPGARGALTRSMMFPPATAPLLGTECVIPADAPAYLAAVYGPGWRSPDPHFAHTKDKASYADLTGA